MTPILIDRNLLELIGIVSGGIMAVAAGAGAYVANRVTMTLSLAELRRTVEEMADDVDGKVESTTCTVTTQRFDDEFCATRATTSNIQLAIARVEGKVDILIRQGVRNA